MMDDKTEIRKAFVTKAWQSCAILRGTVVPSCWQSCAMLRGTVVPSYWHSCAMLLTKPLLGDKRPLVVYPFKGVPIYNCYSMAYNR